MVMYVSMLLSKDLLQMQYSAPSEACMHCLNKIPIHQLRQHLKDSSSILAEPPGIYAPVATTLEFITPITENYMIRNKMNQGIGMDHHHHMNPHHRLTCQFFSVDYQHLKPTAWVDQSAARFR